MTWLTPVAYALFLLLLVYRYATRGPRLSAYQPQRDGPLVSVIVPARNEAVNIERCVRSILQTEYRSIEVIVVDDRSTDATAEIVERLARAPEATGRLQLVRGAELAEGCFGKRVGTHAAVKQHVAEDLALAQLYVRHHLDIFLTHGDQYMAVRMYRSLPEVIEGWSKNLALGVPLMFPPNVLMRRAAPYLMWVPALCWIVPPLAWAVAGQAWAAVTTAISLAIWVAVYRAEGAPVRYTLLYPLGAAMVAYIMIRSALRGPNVEWRGRRYGLGAR